MKRNFAYIGYVVIVILLISLPLPACGQSDSKSVMENVEAKYPKFAPFKITSFEGEVIDMAKLRGTVVVINFWASWCGPCKLEAGELEAVYSAYKAKGVNFVGIAIDDIEANARAFVKRYNVTYPNAIDSDNSLSSRYQIFAIPTTFVIDKAGLIRYTRRGAVTRGALAQEIEKLM